jgi:hypothetical protein
MEQANYFACVGKRKAFPYFARQNGKAPAPVGGDSQRPDKLFPLVKIFDTIYLENYFYL